MLCFVDFTDPKCASIALEALQGMVYLDWCALYKTQCKILFYKIKETVMMVYLMRIISSLCGEVDFCMVFFCFKHFRCSIAPYHRSPQVGKWD